MKTIPYNQFIDYSKKYKYTILFIIFFLYTFIYISIFIGIRDKACNIENKNVILEQYQYFFKSQAVKITVLVIMGIIYLGIFGGIYYFQTNTLVNPNLKLGFMLFAFTMIIALHYLFILFNHSLFKSLSYNTIYSGLSVMISYLFFLCMFMYIVFNIKDNENVINFDNILMIIILVVFGISHYIEGSRMKFAMFNNLTKNKYNFLTMNCFNKSTTSEKFENSSSTKNPSLLQYNQLTQQKGNDYIVLYDDVPIQFKNPITKQYQDFILADFYYPGSYYTYIEDSPIQGHPSLESIQLALTNYKVRIIHLDIFQSKTNIDTPVVRCENMAADAEELDINECFEVIERYGWDTNQNYPLFLYLNIHGVGSEKFYNSLYESYLSAFSGHLMNKKYSFSGRNGTFPISRAPMRECLNKIILITNVYPTRTVFDELIQAGNADQKTTNMFCNIELYKQAYVNFNSVGISQDQDKTNLYTTHQRNLSFYYTEPNMEQVNPSQNKSGLYNTNFQDIAQYGIQGSLMYLFVPDNNLNNWYMFFKSTNNLYPVIKDETLLALEPEKKPIQEQNPILGLQQQSSLYSVWSLEKLN